MIYTTKASRQVNALLRHYRSLERFEAISNLFDALDEAERAIETGTDLGLQSPRPYPAMRERGRRWTKAGRYWICYRPGRPGVVIAVFYDTADIPGRV